MEPGSPAFSLTLTELAGGGDAVGRRQDGLVVFVPGGAPGDVIAAQLVEKAGPEGRRGYARARLVRIETAGAERTAPACPLSSPEQCGGCPLMHVSRSAQLAAKRQWVQRALRHTQATVLPPLAPTPDLGYRVRVRLVVDGGRLGYAGARSHRRVAVSHCAVLHPQLDHVLFTKLQPLAGLLGEAAEVRGLCIGEPAQVQLAIDSGRGAQRKAIRTALLALCAEQVIRGAILDEERLGDADLAVSTSGLGELRLSADGFAQASAAGHDILPRLVADAVLSIDAGDGSNSVRPRWARLLELYAGSGNLTRALRACADFVVCIEGDPQAAARLSRLSAAWNSGGVAVEVIADPVEQALADCLRQGERFPVLVLDPPRTGAREALSGIAALRPERIVYVSCDPMTLGRDLVELERAGFVTRTVQPIDLMPHTAEIECVAVLDAAPPS